jgi:PEP-CTERM motif
MNSNLKYMAGIIAVTLVNPTITQATPFTYQFTQGYDGNNNPTEFGTAAIVKVTLDNGSSSNENQIYSWNQITRLEVSTVGGFFHINSTIAYTTGTSQFLTTDATGKSGQFDFYAGGSINTADTRSPSTISDLTFIELATGNSPTPYLELSDVGSFGTAYWFPHNTTPDIPYQVLVTASLVPEPGTIALLATGLLGFGFSRRKKNQA